MLTLPKSFFAFIIILSLPLFLFNASASDDSTTRVVVLNQDTFTPALHSDPLSSLPAELQYHILQFLSPEDLCRLSLVSHVWHILTKDENLWRRHSHVLGVISNQPHETWKEAFILKQRSLSHYSQQTSLVTAKEFEDYLIIANSFNLREPLWDSNVCGIPYGASGHF
ncbi:F-box-like domain-containing protein [Candidatus Odyssella thessalonicensis]|uniref:F-box-like domain-containing protein n=1 Tax=Candidatus Odyssella thessalonicensis TaxID=84647 RepID=UPI000225B74D|nr:F-box-like domain-containing protein [Candidatus Odyssella thessalonicensis]